MHGCQMMALSACIMSVSDTAERLHCEVCKELLPALQLLAEHQKSKGVFKCIPAGGCITQQYVTIA